MKGWINVAYMAVALGMVIVAVTQVELNPNETMATVFTLVWLSFALLIISSLLHEIIGVDEETRRDLVKIRRMTSRSVAQHRAVKKMKQLQK